MWSQAYADSQACKISVDQPTLGTVSSTFFSTELRMVVPSVSAVFRFPFRRFTVLPFRHYACSFQFPASILPFQPTIIILSDNYLFRFGSRAEVPKLATTSCPSTVIRSLAELGRRGSPRPEALLGSRTARRRMAVGGFAGVCVCVYMCVCMYLSIHASMYLCIYVSMYLCIYVSMYLCMYACMHVCMYACMHACMHVCMYACMHVCMYVCKYVSKYVRKYVCINAYMYVCKYVSTYVCM